MLDNIFQCQPSGFGYIHPVFQFGADLYTNTGTEMGNDAHACQGFCLDVSGFRDSMNLDHPVGLHVCKSTKSTGGLSHALDQRFHFNPEGKGKIKFIVDAAECAAPNSCPSDWVLPLEKCLESVGSELYLKDCAGHTPAQRFKLRMHGAHKGEIRNMGKCLAAVDMEKQTTNCNAGFANAVCAPVTLPGTCTSEAPGVYPPAGVDGNLCHQWIGLEVVGCSDWNDDPDEEGVGGPDGLYTFRERTEWVVNDDPIGYPDFCS